MQQRVGLARAFATEPPILLMDEPFSALDPLIRTKLQDELLQLQRTLKKTIIFVSHDLEEALKIGNRIAIMEGGRIVQTGPPEDIVLRPANDYVAEFVQHMNPLNVLRGALADDALPMLKRIGAMLMLDDDLGLTVALDNAGAAERAALGEHQLKIFESNGEAISWPRGEVVVMPHSAPMRVVIDARHQSGLPILLAQEGRDHRGRARRRHLFRPAGPGHRAGPFSGVTMAPHPLLEGEDDPVVIVNAELEALGTSWFASMPAGPFPGGSARWAWPTAELERHIAWDIGAEQVARRLSRLIDAPLVLQRYSRLGHDCNRPPDAADAMPEISETTHIPGNPEPVARRPAGAHQRDLPAVPRRHRRSARPPGGGGRDPCVVTIHSFTPRLQGHDRATWSSASSTTGTGALRRSSSRASHGVKAARSTSPTGPRTACSTRSICMPRPAACGTP